MFTRPLAAIYAFAMDVRNRHFDACGGYAIGMPVISVGGIHAGGTGKTPLTMLIARQLTESGHTIAFLSRGYKRLSSHPVILHPGQQCGWEHIGDEPYMLRSQFPQSWLGIGANRVQCARRIVSYLKKERAVFMLDDGFQHRRIHRDVDIVCLPPDPFTDRCIPSGYLREPLKSLARAHALCVIGSVDETEVMMRAREKLVKHFPHACVAVLRQTAAEWVNAHTGERATLLPLASPALVCGIARPHRFVAMVEKAGIKPLSYHIYHDHHIYSAADISRAMRGGADGVITTQKDACRLNSIKNLVPINNIWYLMICLEFYDTAMSTSLLSLIEKLTPIHQGP